jgi:2'-5' RNA ligase
MRCSSAWRFSPAAAATVRFVPFPVTLAGLGTFGGANPRVLWLGADGGAALVDLHRAIERVLAELGVTLEVAPFRPHLTLARLQAPPFDSAWPARLAALAPAPRTFTVAAFALVHSELTAAGPRYTVCQRFPAGAADAVPAAPEDRR